MLAVPEAVDNGSTGESVKFTVRSAFSLVAGKPMATGVSAEKRIETKAETAVRIVVFILIIIAIVAPQKSTDIYLVRVELSLPLLRTKPVRQRSGISLSVISG